MINCKNCNSSVGGNFCYNCGQPAQIKRVDSHYVLHEIQHVLHFEKGILYTIKELLLRPEKNIKVFITDNRSRLVKPVVFVIITSLIYTIVVHFFHLENEYIAYSNSGKATLGLIFNWVQSHYGYANIIMGIFVAFWLSVFFRKYEYNFFELLILMCFAIGIEMLIFSLFVFLEGVTKVDLVKISGILGVSYCTFAIGQFFDKKKLKSYLKALIAYLLGTITFLVSIVLLSLFIDFL